MGHRVYLALVDVVVAVPVVVVEVHLSFLWFEEHLNRAIQRNYTTIATRPWECTRIDLARVNTLLWHVMTSYLCFSNIYLKINFQNAIIFIWLLVLLFYYLNLTSTNRCRPVTSQKSPFEYTCDTDLLFLFFYFSINLR